MLTRTSVRSEILTAGSSTSYSAGPEVSETSKLIRPSSTPTVTLARARVAAWMTTRSSRTGTSSMTASSSGKSRRSARSSPRRAFLPRLALRPFRLNRTSCAVSRQWALRGSGTESADRHGQRLQIPPRRCDGRTAWTVQGLVRNRHVRRCETARHGHGLHVWSG